MMRISLVHPRTLAIATPPSDARRRSACTHRARPALVLGVALLGFACNRGAEGTEGVSAEPKLSVSPEQLVGNRVEVVVVEPSKRNLSLTVPGEVEGYRDATLAPAMGGYVERVHVSEGDRVKRGQALASVDSAVHKVRVERAKLEVESTKRELQRAKMLAASIPRAELDAAEDRAVLAEANLKELSLNLQRSLMVAPFSGYLARVDVEVGEVAAPGAPLMRLVQLKPIKVTVALSDRDVAIAKEGGKAVVQLDARSGQFEGIIKSIGRAADMKTRSFEAVIEVPNEDEALLPGMIATVTLDSKDSDEAAPPSESKSPAAKSPAAKSKDAESKEAAGAESEGLVISQDWLVTRPDSVGVFVEKDGKAHWRPVELGSVMRKQVEVKKGIEAGDALIVVGHRELVDGDDVLVHRRGRCCVAGRATFAD